MCITDGLCSYPQGSLHIINCGETVTPLKELMNKLDHTTVTAIPSLNSHFQRCMLKSISGWIILTNATRVVGDVSVQLDGIDFLLCYVIRLLTLHSRLFEDYGAYPANAFLQRNALAGYGKDLIRQ
jgi:hypothetical protein